MESLFPCDHETCLRSALDCDRFMQLVSSGRPCTETALQQLQELSQKLERCLQQSPAPATPPPPRICTHPQNQKVKICYSPECRNKVDRLSCGECALRLHTQCAERKELADVSQHSEKFVTHRLGRPSLALLTKIDAEWAAVRNRLRDFLTAVEDKFREDLIFWNGFDLEAFADNFGDFHVANSGEGFEFTYKNKGLVDSFFSEEVEGAINDFFSRVQALEHSLRTKVSTSYALGDMVHSERNRTLIQNLKNEVLDLGHALRNIQQGGVTGDRILERYARQINSFWGVTEHRDLSPEVVEVGASNIKSSIIEVVLREHHQSGKESRDFDPSLVEGQVSQLDPAKWVCEAHHVWPRPGGDLSKWVVLRLEEKFYFLYVEREEEGVGQSS